MRLSKPKPLMLIQLQSMDGNTVWSRRTGYALVSSNYGATRLLTPQKDYDVKKLLKLGEKIYIRKPENLTPIPAAVQAPRLFSELLKQKFPDQQK